MRFDNNIVKGVYNDAYQFLTIDKRFFVRSKGLKNAINNNKVNDFTFTDEKEHVKASNVTMGKFLQYAMKYMPKTKSRLKGLGEMDDDELWESSLNPATRELIQLTSDNIQMELERFNILHGKDADARKELMKEYILDLNDIDN